MKLHAIHHLIGIGMQFPNALKYELHKFLIPLILFQGLKRSNNYSFYLKKKINEAVSWICPVQSDEMELLGEVLIFQSKPSLPVRVQGIEIYF